MWGRDEVAGAVCFDEYSEDLSFCLLGWAWMRWVWALCTGLGLGMGVRVWRWRRAWDGGITVGRAGVVL